MCHEIEAKLKVDSLENVENKLKQLGAEFQAKFLQTDIYFDHENLNLTGIDTCLRIRKQTHGSVENTLLTYKGPKEKNNFKKRREIEFQISDAEAAEKLFTALGYTKEIIVEKERRFWRFGSCEVLLDDLSQLGAFVEIEGPCADEIERVQKALQLDHLTHIHESYASLIEIKLAEEG
jgi:predicted adenylyl cyclase CyaB